VAALAEDDWRRRAAEFQQPRLGRNLALRDALLPIAQRQRNLGVVHRHCLDPLVAWGERSHCRRRTPKQVDGWIGAAAIKLTRRDLDEIAAAILHSNAGTGPARHVDRARSRARWRDRGAACSLHRTPDRGRPPGCLRSAAWLRCETSALHSH